MPSVGISVDPSWSIIIKKLSSCATQLKPQDAFSEGKDIELRNLLCCRWSSMDVEVWRKLIQHLGGGLEEVKYW